jgi:predicted lipoprotein with Yx(FWY)xxD motif
LGDRLVNPNQEEQMMKSHIVAAAMAVALVSLGAAGPSWGDDMGPFKMMKTGMGNVLSDAKGMTLYTFDKDEAGKSNCTGKCAEFWPPVMASESDKPMGTLTIIKRPDGTMQWADGGKPLYTYADDKMPGEAMGDNKNNVWHVIMAK